MTAIALIPSVFPVGTIIQSNTRQTIDGRGKMVPQQYCMDMEAILPNGRRIIFDIQYAADTTYEPVSGFKYFSRKPNANGFSKEYEFFKPEFGGVFYIYPRELCGYFCGPDVCRIAATNAKNNDKGTDWISLKDTIKVDLSSIARYEEQPVKRMAKGTEPEDYPLISVED